MSHCTTHNSITQSLKLKQNDVHHIFLFGAFFSLELLLYPPPLIVGFHLQTKETLAPRFPFTLSDKNRSNPMGTCQSLTHVKRIRQQ